MDVYGGISVDDLLDLPTDEIYSSSSSSSNAAAVLHHHHHSSATNYTEQTYFPGDFTDILSVPPDDAVELEWVAKYMDDSFADFPAANELTAAAAAANSRSRNGGVHGRARSKRSRPAGESPISSSGGGGASRGESYGGGAGAAENGEVPRRCTHCASEKTPQWRTGPLGPKTLCNACGVRYKSGRLVPEYRPAASPTFVLTQHSNSHRKVMELRRQKDMLRGQHQQEMLQQQEGYGGGRHIPGMVTSPVHVSSSHLWKVKSEYV